MSTITRGNNNPPLEVYTTTSFQPNRKSKHYKWWWLHLNNSQITTLHYFQIPDLWQFLLIVSDNQTTTHISRNRFQTHRGHTPKKCNNKYNPTNSLSYIRVCTVKSASLLYFSISAIYKLKHGNGNWKSEKLKHALSEWYFVDYISVIVTMLPNMKLIRVMTMLKN